MSEPDDHQLMLAVQNGKPEPLTQLFSRHHGSLFNFFRKLGNTRADAEDLTQETFIRMLKYAHSYQSQGTFLPWMYRVARNTAHDAWRPDAELACDADTELATAAAPQQQEPDAQLAQDELEARLQLALLRLPPDKRELILLSRVKLLGIDDLASLYECSSSVIKVRLHRSLQLLRSYFDKNTDQPQEQE